jgi:hypothetical protein
MKAEVNITAPSLPLYLLAQPEDYDEANDKLTISTIDRQLIFSSSDVLVMIFFSTPDKARSFAKAAGLKGTVVRCEALRLLKVLVGYQPQWITIDPSISDENPPKHSTRKIVEALAKNQGLKVNFVD